MLKFVKDMFPRLDSYSFLNIKSLLIMALAYLLKKKYEKDSYNFLISYNF
ncbi:hypothetical protein EAVVTKC53_00523 [Elizabethkingia anophelis]|nr:hypothetical protein EAVVTKC53_01509 [Elizabethkingia anophelis]CAI9678032.1 hypothetical protein EAVVTKC53_00523 [Elizabethkingia anophelis]